MPSFVRIYIFWPFIFPRFPLKRLLIINSTEVHSISKVASVSAECIHGPSWELQSRRKRSGAAVGTVVVVCRQGWVLGTGYHAPGQHLSPPACLGHDLELPARTAKI